MPLESGTPPTDETNGFTRSGRVLRWVLVSVALLVVVVGLILYLGYTAGPRWEWVGDTDKRFWHYLDLLIVPLVIAGGVATINWMQSERERNADAKKREHERRAEEASRNRALAVENQRAQDKALRAYLDQMSMLLLDRNLRSSEGNSEVRTLARADADDFS
jgi:uncharacterized membrane protein